MSQSLMVPLPLVLLKLAAAYELAAPDWATKTPGFPWNQSIRPPGELLLTTVHPAGVTVLKPSDKLAASAVTARAMPMARRSVQTRREGVGGARFFISDLVGGD